MDVLFAVMPFADLQAPSLGVSLLKANLEHRGISAGIRYYAFELGEQLGPELYNAIAGYGDYSGVANAPPTETLIGEWFFAEHLFGDRLPPAAEYLAEFIEGDPQLDGQIPRMLKARGRIGTLVERWARDILARRPRLVGFSTSFYQTCACLAVAKELKKRRDAPLVVFGGANCAGEMGAQLLRSFPFIDYVCTGEGDEVFPLLLDRILSGEEPGSVPGIIARSDPGHRISAPLVHDLDALPFPDFSDYFQQLHAADLEGRITPHLLVETARGCWWGAKHHCTFCGLNTEGMAFRAKSAERVHDELQHLWEAYGVRQIDCVDNILHMPYLRTLFPRLIESEPQLQLFFETKANLKRAHLATLRAAGVWCIQPGIESFSDDVLDLMRKGCTGLQNIQLLRWCAEEGLEVIWNIIFGFPGEAAGEYERMAELIPNLTHLRRPTFTVRLRLDRFSPYFMDPSGSGLQDVRPAAAYRHVFPLEPDEVANVAYFFDFDYQDSRDPLEYTARLRVEVDRWADVSTGPAEDRPRLDLFETPSVALVKDSRSCAVRPVHVLDGISRELYLSCDTAQSGEGLLRRFPELDPAEIRMALQQLVDARLMIEMDGRFLSLAVFRTRSPDGVTEQRHHARLPKAQAATS